MIKNAEKYAEEDRRRKVKATYSDVVSTIAPFTSINVMLHIIIVACVFVTLMVEQIMMELISTPLDNHVI